MITASVVMDLSNDSESADRREVGALYGVPTGARVVIKVGDRRFVPPWTVAQLRQYVDSLHFEVQGSTVAVSAWVAHLRGEDPLGLGASA